MLKRGEYLLRCLVGFLDRQSSVCGTKRYTHRNALLALAYLLSAIDVEELYGFAKLSACLLHNSLDSSNLKLIVANEREVTCRGGELRKRYVLDLLIDSFPNGLKVDLGTENGNRYTVIIRNRGVNLTDNRKLFAVSRNNIGATAGMI